MAAAPLGNAEKAVIFLLTLDENVATQVLSHMDEAEIRRAREVLDRLRDVPPDTMQGVYDEFLGSLDRQSVNVRGGGEYLRRLATRAFGPERAARLLQEPRTDAATTLSRIDTTMLAGFLGDEHPQTVAAILAHLEPERAADVMARLPGPLQAEAAARIAALAEVPRHVLDEAERVLAAGLATEREACRQPIDGVRRAAAILNRMDHDAAAALIEQMGESNGERATAIKRAMFTFDDLASVDRRGMQVLLKEIASEQLLLALKTAGDDLKEQILGAMSRRAGEMIRDDLEAMGPVRLSEVERAQQEIAEIALRLQSEGKLNIAGAGGEQYV